MGKRKRRNHKKLLRAKKRSEAIRLHSARQKSKKAHHINNEILDSHQEHAHKNRGEFEVGFQTGYKKGFNKGLIDGSKYL